MFVITDQTEIKGADVRSCRTPPRDTGVATSLTTVDKAAIFSILFAAAMRDDTDFIAQSEWWSDLQTHFIVSFLKEYSITILVLTGILIVLSGLRRRHFYTYLTLGPLIFLMYAVCRGSIEDSELVESCS